MNRKPRKVRFGPLLVAVLIAVFLYAYVTQLNVNRALEYDLIGVRKALHEMNRNQLELESKVSAVQVAVVETKVALSVKQTVGKPVKSRKVKPVTHEAPKTESTYVDPVSTFVVGGVLTVGKSIITNGGRLLGTN